MASISRPAPVLHDDLPDGVLGMTNGHQIFLRSDLTHVEHRCAYEHELVHFQRGHTSCQPFAIEKDVQREVARRLLPRESMEKAARWARSASEAAAELDVTLDIYLARVEDLQATGRPITAPADDPIFRIADGLRGQEWFTQQH